MFSNHIFQLINSHKLAVYLGTGLGLILLVMGIQQEVLDKTIAYLLVLISCFILSEFIIFYKKISLQEPIVKDPKKELLVISSVIFLGGLILIFRFNILGDFQEVESWVRIVLFIFRAIFLFPVFILIYFLFVKRYSLKQIGFSLKYGYVSLPIIVLFGSVSFIFFKSGLQIQDFEIQTFLTELILLGFLSAAIPEEISRHLFQTRLNIVLNSKSLGWFIASSIWAVSHIPLFSSGDGGFQQAVYSTIGILPIGLFWGYLNQRYKSIIPSVLIHATNIWGLHNIF